MISLLTPTRERPDRFMDLCESLIQTTTRLHDVELIAYLQNDDGCVPMYLNMVEYISFARYVYGNRIVMSDMWNALLPAARGNIFMLCADDVLFRTVGWDEAIRKAFESFPDHLMLAFANDGGPNGKRFASLPFVSREWVDVVGYFTGPGFSADYSDTWPNDVAEMIGRRVYVDVLIEHMHPIWNKAKIDQVYADNQTRLYRDNCRGRYEATLSDRVRDANKLMSAIRQYEEIGCKTAAS